MITVNCKKRNLLDMKLIKITWGFSQISIGVFAYI